jgi:hypothetical protein
MAPAEADCGFATPERKSFPMGGIPLGGGKNCAEDEALASKDDVFKMLFVLDWDWLDLEEEAAADVDDEDEEGK